MPGAAIRLEDDGGEGPAEARSGSGDRGIPDSARRTSARLTTPLGGVLRRARSGTGRPVELAGAAYVPSSASPW